MTEKEILLAFLGKTLNQAPEQLAELLYQTSDEGETLKDDALNTLLGLDAERVQKLKPNTKEYFDNGYKKAQSEIQERVEKELRQRFNVDAEGKLKGSELYDAINAAMATEGGKPDKVKTSAEYLALEREMRKQIEELQAGHQSELENIRREAQREQTWAQVSGRIRDAIRKHTGLNQEAITDPMVDLLAIQFRDYDYQQDGDDWLPLKDGQRVEDAHGHARRLADLVAERAETVFPRIAQQPAGSAGNQNGNGKTAITTRWKDENEYLTALAGESDPAKRVEMFNAWEAQQARAN